MSWPLHISPVDAVVVLLYFCAVSWIAWRSSQHQKSARGFLIGEREIPWWAAMLSIIGTEISALTFVGVPAYAYAKTGNFSYLMGGVGMIFARMIVAKWFVPAYYRYDVVSIYEFLERRFGPWTRNLAVLIFMFTRVAMSGVRLYAGSIIVAEAVGVSYSAAIIITAAIATVYTILGGIRSVIWTEVMQVCVMFGGALAAACILYNAMPDGWHSIAQATAGMDKFRLVDTTFSFTSSEHEFSIWSALIGLTIFNLSIFGTDYDMVQRMLTTNDAKHSARAVVTSALADVPIATLFLSIGIMLFAYYSYFPDPTLPMDNGEVIAKKVFPHFILTQIPHGLVGLVVAGILSVALSSFQSALNALSASFTVDVYRRHLVRSAPDHHYVQATRLATVGFAVLLTMVAFLSAPVKNLLILGLEIPSYTYCALLGVFLVGILTRRGTDRSCALAMLLTIPFVLFVLHQWMGLAWTWNAFFGTAFSVSVALTLGWSRRFQEDA
ncbi:MAG: sodium/solute symporter [Armatimonadetes bacterium]|nr:sodium/solute symporter [Armatimonadota bacterium]